MFLLSVGAFQAQLQSASSEENQNDGLFRPAYRCCILGTYVVCSVSIATDIWSILQQEVGAKGTRRSAFLRWVSSGTFAKEFRFFGNLGFGGKLHVGAEYLYVSMYSEDETPDRFAAVQTANTRLKALGRNPLEGYTVSDRISDYVKYVGDFVGASWDGDELTMYALSGSTVYCEMQPFSVRESQEGSQIKTLLSTFEADLSGMPPMEW